jgi:hypothetical protein
MTIRFPLAAVPVAFGLALAPAAHAGCQTLAAQADRLQGARLVAGYESLIRCSEEEAKINFSRFMQRSGDSETLTALSLAAIDNDIWNPVWEMIGKISDYSARDLVAKGVGEACVDHPKVVSFLQGAYFGLRDIEFHQWDDALISCKAQDFNDWMVQTVESPPPKRYDEKWDTMAKSYVIREREAGLVTLVNAAAKAAENGGPFDAILGHMEQSVMPEFGISIPEEARPILEKALMDLAKRCPPDKARAVAGRLSNAGSDAAAASLLPSIYPDRVQTGGGFLYGAAAVESGDCAGEKVAVLHVALVNEPGKHFALQPPLATPMRSFKPRLAKCQTTEPWPIVVSGAPLQSKTDVEMFADQLSMMWTMKGFEVRRRNEKTVDLP